MCRPSPLQHLILKHEFKSAVGAKSGRLHDISQGLRERRSIGSSCRTSNCWCREQGGYACSRWSRWGAHPTLPANEQRPSRSLRRRSASKSAPLPNSMAVLSGSKRGSRRSYPVTDAPGQPLPVSLAITIKCTWSGISANSRARLQPVGKPSRKAPCGLSCDRR